MGNVLVFLLQVYCAFWFGSQAYELFGEERYVRAVACTFMSFMFVCVVIVMCGGSIRVPTVSPRRRHNCPLCSQSPCACRR